MTISRSRRYSRTLAAAMARAASAVSVSGCTITSQPEIYIFSPRRVHADRG